MDRGESMGNGSWTGILGLLRNDQCDFVVGGFFPGNQELNSYMTRHSSERKSSRVLFSFYPFVRFLHPFSMHKTMTSTTTLV